MARERPDFELPWIVPHPRYGDAPSRSAQRLPTQEVQAAYPACAAARAVQGGYRSLPRTPLQRELQRLIGDRGTGVVFVDSAIAADCTRQRDSVMPRRCYADVLLHCRDCGEAFLFFASEQRHWYEVLRFDLSAGCVRCCACRAADQRLRRAQQRYGERIGTEATLAPRALASLLLDALFLAESGLLKRHTTLRGLRNVARRRGVSGEACVAIDAFLAAASAPS